MNKGSFFIEWYIDIEKDINPNSIIDIIIFTIIKKSVVPISGIDIVIECTKEMINIDRQLIPSFTSDKIALKII